MKAILMSAAAGAVNSVAASNRLGATHVLARMVPPSFAGEVVARVKAEENPRPCGPPVEWNVDATGADAPFQARYNQAAAEPAHKVP
jgi:hypothetical protein